MYRAVIILVLALCAGPYISNAKSDAPRYVCRVKNVYPHDTGASTQGLVVDGEVLYESTGLFPVSTLRKVDLTTGTVLLRHELTGKLFGEGIALLSNKIYQLTWQSGRVFVYDRESFRVLKEFAISTEGWGLTSYGNRLVMSDGSAVLRFIDPETFRETGQITVHDANGHVKYLNELEYVEGLIFANIYLKKEIVMINPETGQIVGRLSLDNLAARIFKMGHREPPNGIAYDSRTGRLFITGKRWPLLFEVELLDKKSGQVLPLYRKEKNS